LAAGTGSNAAPAGTGLIGTQRKLARIRRGAIRTGIAANLTGTKPVQNGANAIGNEINPINSQTNAIRSGINSIRTGISADLSGIWPVFVAISPGPPQIRLDPVF